ncbi:MAG: dihydropyrimidinase [Actinomycetia bacterium]|nr:dihydropyrimidinase [Actinomycetes bacterium]
MLIAGGRVVDVEGDRVADVRTGADGRIAAVGALVPLDGEEVVDATGCLVVPGGVDAHTHLHLPLGAVSASDGFPTGTAAAAIGGTTTLIEYVTAHRGERPLDALATWERQAEGAAIDYGFHMTFTEAVGEGAVADCVERGVTSFKLYMAYPETLMVEDDVIVDVLRAAHKHGGLVTVHAENGGAIEALRREALAAGHTGVINHARTRPAVLEAEAVSHLATLVERTESRAYVVHLSSAPALAAIRQAQERGIHLLAETCPQYLHLDVSRLAGDDGEQFVCTPPLRDPWHAEELWHGLASGWIHTVATDHCPFTTEDRQQGMQGRSGGWADFTEIPGGLPGIETRMALVWTGVRAGKITAADWVRLCAEAPAQTFGLWPAKGSLRVGADADVVVWDPERRQSLDAAALHMRTDHSPYEGMVATGWPALVLSRGRPVARDGAFVGEPSWGRFVPRVPSSSA